jgi:bacteriocin-like protein
MTSNEILRGFKADDEEEKDEKPAEMQELTDKDLEKVEGGASSDALEGYLKINSDAKK